MTSADFVSLEPYRTLVPPDVFDRMLACLDHDADCNCWADDA